MAGTGRLVRTKGGTKFKRKNRKVWPGEHDWNKFPEVSLTSPHLSKSPHKQIDENIIVEAVRVKDADTIEVKWSERNFLFSVRLINVYAPEKNTWDGRKGRDWLKRKLEGREIELIINKHNRVGKWGRLLAVVMFQGVNINQQLISEGIAITTVEKRRES